MGSKTQPQIFASSLRKRQAYEQLLDSFGNGVINSASWWKWDLWRYRQHPRMLEDVYGDDVEDFIWILDQLWSTVCKRYPGICHGYELGNPPPPLVHAWGVCKWCIKEGD